MLIEKFAAYSMLFMSDNLVNGPEFDSEIAFINDNLIMETSHIHYYSRNAKLVSYHDTCSRDLAYCAIRFLLEEKGQK